VPTAEEVEKVFLKEEKAEEKKREQKKERDEATKVATRKALVAALKTKLGREPTEEDIVEGLKEAREDAAKEAKKRKADEKKEKERFETKVLADLRVALGRRREPSDVQKQQALKEAYSVIRKEKDAEKRVESKKRKAEEDAEVVAAEKLKKKLKRDENKKRKKAEEAVEAAEEETKELKRQKQRAEKKAKIDKEAQDGLKPLKKANTAYSYFAASARKEVKKENKEANAAEITGIVQAKWEALDEEGRFTYVEQETQDKARFSKDVAEYEKTKNALEKKTKSPSKTPSKSVKKPSAKSPVVKTLKGPKKPRSAFNFFQFATRPAVAKANPKLTPSEVSALVSTQWKALVEELRKPFIVQAIADKERYDAAVEDAELQEAMEAEERKMSRKSNMSEEEELREAMEAEEKKMLKKEKADKRKSQEGGEKKVKKVKAEKTPKADKQPVRAKTSFQFYSKSARGAVVKDMPDATTEAIAKRMREMWNALDTEGKAPFELSAATDKQRADNETAAWQKRQSLVALGVTGSTEAAAPSLATPVSVLHFIAAPDSTPAASSRIAPIALAAAPAVSLAPVSAIGLAAPTVVVTQAVPEQETSIPTPTVA
jgi:hypothetical protein